MTPVPDRSTFESAYAGQAPWDIGRPQKPFIDIADQITGSILDAGCGTGENALFFASRGHKVTGIDFIEEAINRKVLEARHGKVWSAEELEQFVATAFVGSTVVARRGADDMVGTLEFTGSVGHIAPTHTCAPG